MAVHQAAQAARVRKERVRGDDQPSFALFQPPEVVEGPHILRAPAEIEQQHVLALDRPLDPSNQDDSTVRGVRNQRFNRQLFIVKCDRERPETEMGGLVDEISGGVRDVVARVVGCMSM